MARLGLADADEIEKRFGSIPVSILEGLNLISKVHTKVSMSQADNFRDLIVSYSTDPRIILIKLADRLEVMRSLAMFPEGKQRKKSWESMNLYAQIAHKLGLYSIKSELEDIALKYLEPEDYAYISRRLEETAAERDEFIAGFVAPIRERLDAQGIQYHIKGRTKSVYSIWRKMKRTGVSFDEVYDIFAIRIIVECPTESEKQLCWSIYSIVTDFYTPNPDRMRDWISIPKSNGYESLHTTVVTKDGHWVEIQIRSERMDEVAERGIAAHWRYKGVHGSGSRNDEWLARLREIMEESTNKTQIANKIDTESTSEEVFVFTPAGDLRKLPKGSHSARFRIRHPHPCGSRLYRCEDRRTQRLHQGGVAQRRHRKHHHRQDAEAQSRLAQLRRDGKGPQQNQGVPARRGGQSGPVRTRGARTQTEKLETQHSD